MKVFDVSVPIHTAMVVYRGNPAVQVRPFMTLKRDGVNVSELRLGSHTGTHVDAPVHFLQGRKGVDALDPTTFIGPAVVADLSHVVGRIDARALAAARIPRGVPRILLRTTNSRLWHPARRFRTDFVYLTPDGADWVVGRGARLLGFDYLSVEGFTVSGAPTHRRLLGAGIPILEGLDLWSVPPGRYNLAALPLRIRGGDAAPTRAVLWRERD